MTKHGISVRHKQTNELVEFIECETGRPALQVLAGIRINMSTEYKAEESDVNKEEIIKLEELKGK